MKKITNTNSRPIALLLQAYLLFPTAVFAHGVASDDATYLQQIQGVQFLPFVYLGGKHMITGYDHLLFLLHGWYWENETNQAVNISLVTEGYYQGLVSH